ncbi:MAG: hypothetical protein PHF37_06565 [Phycisphaerae bacterium]|nr:hypothetical protein [Phycisphaerae bacterium]
MDTLKLEKYSSAITLSDMEIFVFPELMYSLILANIMSPILWQWREDESFKKLGGKNSYRKLMRLKQYIMDNYEFNLDLETWGLTKRQRELDRFKDAISSEDIASSNALFGYHGDKYYFDVGIRKHFGLDKYDSDIIPYWKTETVEAMDAFKYKKGFTTGAGECVSLAALYAAAAFVVCGVPLEDIFMVLTPLHSQNFIDLKDGVLTNNRRLVTKTMWFNGTALTEKAQRALRNEQVTIVAHNTGYIHCFYDEATIDKKEYERFDRKIGAYLSSDLNVAMLASFLRANRHYQKYFQMCRDCRGTAQFVRAEVLFHYEHTSNYQIADTTYEKLLNEVSEEDFVRYELPGRIRCDRLSELISEYKPDLRKKEHRDRLRQFIESYIPDAEKFVEELAGFLYFEPKLPGAEKGYIKTEPIKIGVTDSREQIIEYLSRIRNKNETADLAFYAYRDMESCEWEPVVKAATERNPVSLEAAKNMSIDQAYLWLSEMRDFSIYDGKRLGQPDEVVNYGTGDGLEKAFVLANIIRNRNPEQNVEIAVENTVTVVKAEKEYRFDSAKGLVKNIKI